MFRRRFESLLWSMEVFSEDFLCVDELPYECLLYLQDLPGIFYNLKNLATLAYPKTLDYIASLTCFHSSSLLWLRLWHDVQPRCIMLHLHTAVDT